MSTLRLHRHSSGVNTPTGSGENLSVEEVAEAYALFLAENTLSERFYLTRRKFKLWCRLNKLKFNPRRAEVWKAVLRAVEKYFVIEGTMRSSNHLVWVLKKKPVLK